MSKHCQSRRVKASCSDTAVQLRGSIPGLALGWLLPGMQRCAPRGLWIHPGPCPGNLKHLWALHLLTHQPGWRVAPWSWSCPEAQNQPGQVMCCPLTEEQILPFSSSAGKFKERNEGWCKRHLLCLLLFLFNEGYRKKNNMGAEIEIKKYLSQLFV